mmetsp:Transcript_132843/g.283880  ORF Transcript_132843/g.283880 Transcript_132843/m.283880 type:complete len:207 (+) Transcript_132843:1082-1702(+)
MLGERARSIEVAEHVVNAPEDRFVSEHQNQRNQQQEANKVLLIQNVPRHRDMHAHRNVSGPHIAHHAQDVSRQEATQAEDVNEEPANEDRDALALIVLAFAYVYQDGLTRGEDYKVQEEPELSLQEAAESEPAPHEVCQRNQKRVANKLGILGFVDPLDGLRETSVGIHEQVPQVVVDPPVAVFRQARAPNQSIQEHRNERRGISG